MQRIHVVDSHTGGEPTRVVVAGGPELGNGSLAARRERFSREFDRYRRAVVDEPRGSEVMVGALLVEPEDPACAAGVIFFNNAGCIGMCGHGTIGLVVTLAHLGRIRPGEHRIETPVGVVRTVLDDSGEVAVANVASWRAHKARARGAARSSATSPGAETGSFSSRRTGRRSRSPTRHRSRIFAGACGVR
jgi:4-hydroxyproline epimerase